MTRWIYITLLMFALAGPRCADARDEPARPGVIESFEIMQGDVPRRYDIYVPENAPADRPRSLVFVLHGGWKADVEAGEVKSGKPPGRGMSKLTGGGWEKVAERENVVIVYPVAVNARWNDGQPDTQRITHATDDVGFIAMLIDRIAPAYGVDPARVYASGFSNGAKMSFRLACELDDRIAAVAPVDGGIAPRLRPACRPERAVPVVFFHGTEYPRAMMKLYEKMDQDPNAVFADTIAFWTERNGCDADAVSTRSYNVKFDGTTVVKNEYTSCREADVTVYRVEGGGHVWPGGAQYFPRFLIGRGSREIDAAAQAWRFLKNHTLGR